MVWKSNGPWMKVFRQVALRRKKLRPKAPERLSDHGVKPCGDQSFTGRQDALKESSGYTKSMGVAMALSYMGFTADSILRFLDASREG